jgi:hypothetical protein
MAMASPEASCTILVALSYVCAKTAAVLVWIETAMVTGADYSRLTGAAQPSVL